MIKLPDYLSLDYQVIIKTLGLTHEDDKHRQYYINSLAAAVGIPMSQLLDHKEYFLKVKEVLEAFGYLLSNTIVRYKDVNGCDCLMGITAGDNLISTTLKNERNYRTFLHYCDV